MEFFNLLFVIPTQHFVRSNTSLEEPVLKVMGSTLFAAFMVSLSNHIMNNLNLQLLLTMRLILFWQHKPDSLYMNLDDTQAELLLTSKVKITDGGDKSVLTELKI